jgi:outer membrane protein assembly factor BamB
VATCAEAATGKVLWNERLEGDYSASLIGAEGRVYFINEAGLCTVVKAAPTFEVVAKNDLGERTLASPAVADGALFIRTKEHLYRIGQPKP